MAEGTLGVPLPPAGPTKQLRTLVDGANQPAGTHQEVDSLAHPDGTLVVVGAGLPVALDVNGQLTSLLTELGQKLEPGGAVAVSNLPAAPLTDTQLRATAVAVSQGVNRQKTHVEFIPSSAAPTTIYEGYAPVGTADAAALWTIQRFVFTGTTNIDETWSSTTAVWADRAAAVYT